MKRTLSAFLRLLLHSRRSPSPIPEAVNRILIIRQHNQLGDMLCVVPLLRALRSKYPAAYVALVASPVNRDVMLQNRYLNEVITYGKSEFIGRTGSFWNLVEFVRSLRSRNFDVAIVPSTVSTSFTSDFLAYLSGAAHRIGVGCIDGRENLTAYFFNHPVNLQWENTPHRHQVLRNLDIASELGVASTELSIEMTLDTAELARGRGVLEGELTRRRTVIAFHPGAGKLPNRWPAENFTEAANILSREFEADIVITSGPMDTEATEAMIKHLKVPYKLIENEAIRHVASILKYVHLLISNDTGIMHVAAAVGVPVLSLFGPTDPEQWAPIGAQNRYIHSSNGSLTSITVDEVLSNAREMLRRLRG